MYIPNGYNTCYVLLCCGDYGEHLSLWGPDGASSYLHRDGNCVVTAPGGGRGYDTVKDPPHPIVTGETVRGLAECSFTHLVRSRG